MKVRIIKTSAGYIPQVYTKSYGETAWYSLGKSGGVDALWSEPQLIYRFCTHYTKWGAMQTLEKYLKLVVGGTHKLDAFSKELEQPNVVYQAEV